MIGGKIGLTAVRGDFGEVDCLGSCVGPPMAPIRGQSEPRSTAAPRWLVDLENLDGIDEDRRRLTGRVVIANRDIRH